MTAWATDRTPCPITSLPTHELTWPKLALIVAACAVGGFIGGVGLAALVTTIIGRRALDALTGP
jgi:hypothetical protein